MSHFCHQISYTSSAWRRILQSPGRFDSLRSPIESLSGTLHAVFFALDSYNVLAITEFPESVSPADISVAFFASGEVAQIHTTRLLDATQGVDAMRKAVPSVYHPGSRDQALAASS
jgi:uncharacterized protein with GYD domain